MSRCLPRLAFTRREFFFSRLVVRGGGNHHNPKEEDDRFEDQSKDRDNLCDRLQGKYPISVCSIRGGRPTMEDEFITTNDCMAVFDGHGGNAVAQYLRFNLGAALQAAAAAANFRQEEEEGVVSTVPVPTNDEPSSKSIPGMDHTTGVEILRSTLLKMDEEVKKIKHWSFQGSTAVVLWMPSSLEPFHTLVIANVGDSRAVLSRNAQCIELTQDHKPNHPQEQMRIEAAGGKVEWVGVDEFNGMFRLNGSMALSRAIGDNAEPLAIADPDMIVLQIQSNDEFIVVATDGLWDVLSSQDVVAIVHGLLHQQQIYGSFDRDEIASLLVEEALRRYSDDNITVMILWLK